MNTLTVSRFRTPLGADEAVPRLRRLALQRVLAVDDAALVTWPPDRRKPSVRVLGGLTRPGALWGGFWGMLLGLVFLVPLAGPTFGACAGALASGLADFGIEDDYVKRVRDLVTPGSSALFLITEGAVAATLAAALDDLDVDSISTTISAEQEERLHAALGEESQAPPP
jgi:uncharacterized membrane protein